MNLEKRGYCVVRGINKEPVGLDTPSGGYPYSTNDPAHIHVWGNPVDAESYAKTMNGRNEGASYHGPFNARRCVLTLTLLED